MRDFSSLFGKHPEDPGNEIVTLIAKRTGADYVHPNDPTMRCFKDSLASTREASLHDTLI